MVKKQKTVCHPTDLLDHDPTAKISCKWQRNPIYAIKMKNHRRSCGGGKSDRGDLRTHGNTE